MKLALSFLTALVASASAQEDIKANSRLGSNLLSKARRVNAAYEEDLTWVSDYSIKFEKCFSIHGRVEEGNQNDGGADYGVDHLVKFKLCPSNACGSCSGGAEYVVDMMEFVTAYTEVQDEIKEANCEAVEESCYCNGDDDQDNCMSACYATAGLDYCGDDDEFDVAEYMECREAEFGNYYNAYYIGPVCTGSKIFLKLYSDAQCTTAAANGVYEQYNYNAALPYSKKSVVGTDCLSCLEAAEANDDGNGNNYYSYEPSEFCTELYEESAKCEKKLKAKSKDYRDTGSCDYINNILPSLESVYKRGGSGGASTAFAWIFFVSTLGASGAAYHFYTQVQRSSVGLSSKDGGIVA